MTDKSKTILWCVEQVIVLDLIVCGTSNHMRVQHKLNLSCSTHLCGFPILSILHMTQPKLPTFE